MASNYPDGMSRSDYDHVEGVIRCQSCGADITREWEDAEEDITECPGGCYEPDPDLMLEERRERREAELDGRDVW